MVRPTAKSSTPKASAPAPPQAGTKRKCQDDEEYSAPDKRLVQANLVTTLKRQTKDPQTNRTRQRLLEYYQSLPRSSAEKEDILARWQADKTFTWVDEYIKKETKSTTMEVTQSAKTGWGTIFQLADILKLRTDDPKQKKILDSIAANLPSDLDWDESNPIEAQYKAIGLMRYRIDFHDLDSLQNRTTATEELTEVTRNKESASVSIDDEKKEKGVKEEREEEPEMKELLAELNKIEAKLGGSTNDMRRTKAQVLSKTDMDVDRRASDMQSCMNAHEEIHNQLLSWITAANCGKKTEKDLKDGMDILTECKTHVEAARKACKRCKHWLESLSA